MDNLPPCGAKELRQSEDGRRYLAELQKKHEIDLLQPGNPKFDKVYGDKIKKQEDTRQKIAQESQAQWNERYERKMFPTRTKKYL